MNGTTLSVEEIRHIAALAMITLTDEEVKKYQQQLPAILEYVKKVDEIVSNAEGFVSHVDLKNVLREDSPEKSLAIDEVLLNRQKTSQSDCFVVSSVLSSEGE